MPRPPINPMAGKTANLPSYLRRKGALVALHVDIQAYTPAAKGDPDRFAQSFFTIQDRAGKELAEAARDAMKRLLQPGGDPGIGVTGAASENLFVRSVDRVQQRGGVVTEVVWYVYEGDKTRANKAIRKGVRAHPAKWSQAYSKSLSTRKTGGGSSNIRGGFLGSLSAWAREKHLVPEMTILGVGREKRKRNAGILNAARRKTPWESMLWAIWHKMQAKGISSEYKERYGVPFYDYVSRVTGGKAARGGSSDSSFRRSVQSRLGKKHRGEVWANVDRITTDYVYTMFGKIGRRLVSGRVTGRSIGSNPLPGVTDVE